MLEQYEEVRQGTLSCCRAPPGVQSQRAPHVRFPPACGGESLETVQALLGHSDLDHVMPCLEEGEDTLREMFEAVL